MDKRSSERARTFLTGRIIFNDRSSVIDCIVRDLSPGGARITFDHPISIPDQFELEIPRRNISAPVRVAWSDTREHGVAFLTAQLSPSRPPAERRSESSAGGDATAGEEVVEVLTRLLADHLALHVRTRGLYWQAKATGSPALERALAEQSRALLTLMDRIAERVHGSGGDGFSTLEQAAVLAHRKEDGPAPSRPRARMESLIADHLALVGDLESAHRAAGRHADKGSIHLIGELREEAESRRTALLRLRLDPSLT